MNLKTVNGEYLPLSYLTEKVIWLKSYQRNIVVWEHRLKIIWGLSDWTPNEFRLWGTIQMSEGYEAWTNEIFGINHPYMHYEVCS